MKIAVRASKRGKRPCLLECGEDQRLVVIRSLRAQYHHGEASVDSKFPVYFVPSDTLPPCWKESYVL